MKWILITVSTFIMAPLPLADAKQSPVKQAEVIVFDAICTPASASQGFLTVALQMRATGLFVRGSFYSYSKVAPVKDPKKRHVISLDDCNRIQRELVERAGRKVFLDGEYFERPFDAYEDVWGTCREHPLAGGGTYRCKKGTRLVTKYDKQVVLEIDGMWISNTYN